MTPHGSASAFRDEVFAGLIALCIAGTAGCTGRADLATLQDPQACGSCHPDHTTEWSGSMHAYSSTDPLFRTLNAIGQKETDGELGDFCVRCHAPLAVELGLTEDGLNLDEVPENLQGVNCYFCHSVNGIDGAHNNPLTLANDGVMRGGLDDPQRNNVHESRYSPLLDRNDARSSDLCGTCHDIVTPRGVHIERTYLEWGETLYASEDFIDQNLNCGSCHMKGEDAPAAVFGNREYPIRRRHAHTWPAVDIALTDFPERETQRALVENELATVINPQLCVSVDPVAQDTSVTVDIENLAAGHSFPSGAAADRRVWVEVIAYEGEQIVYESGRIAPGEPAKGPDAAVDPDRWLLGDTHFDERGDVTHFFWEVDDYSTDLLPGPTARDPNDPAYRETHRIRTYPIEGQTPDRVTLRMYLRPFGLDIVDEILADHPEEAAEFGVDADLRAAIPTFDLESAALDWTSDLGRPCVRLE